MASTSAPKAACPTCGQPVELRDQTNVSKAFPNRWVAAAKVLRVVFNGQPVEVKRRPTEPVSSIMERAAKLSGNEQYFLGNESAWEARDGLGRLLEPSAVPPKLHWDCADLLYVNPRPGVGA